MSPPASPMPATALPQTTAVPAPPRALPSQTVLIAGALVALTALAAFLRLDHLAAVPNDPFYDAAVRSMGDSWRNLFLGAFEPGGSVSIDKPPLDLWLQVASVKLLGFGSFSLKLPEALAGTAAVPALWAALRRPFGELAALGGAAVLTITPIDVITARSDTMDAVMMLLLVAALGLTLSACRTGRTRTLLLAAAALGLAFDVKLLESAIAVVPLALIALLGLPGPGRRRAAQLAAAATVYGVVALAWLTATLLVAHRPYAIGSTDGSAWNAAFVFNGTDRLSGSGATGETITYGNERDYPTATQTQRDHVPITAPGPARLLARVGPLSGERLGLLVLAALLLGAPALALRLAGRGPPRAAAAGLLLWLGLGVILFSAQARLHPRYVEAFTPAVAATLGIGIAWATASRRRLPWLAVSLAILLAYAAHLVYGPTAAWGVTLIAALTALGIGLGGGRRVPGGSGAAATAAVLVVVGAIPLTASLRAVDERVSDAGRVGVIPARELTALRSYLRRHSAGTRYEAAVASATAAGALIVADDRPVLVLTTYNARPFTTVRRLRALARAGAVRYAYLNTPCSRHPSATDAGCVPTARWIRAHGVDVSRGARLRPGVLWRLPS